MQNRWCALAGLGLIGVLGCWALARAEPTTQAGGEAGAVALSFPVEGASLAGVFYAAAAKGPAPTVILVQGYPGREGDLFGLGTFLSQAGINVFAFNYRGSWKSGGDFSVEHAVADVIAAVAFLSRSEIAERYQVDPANLTLVGYSFGGGMVLLGGRSCPAVKRIISIGTSNLRVTADNIEAIADYRAGHLRALAAGATVIRSTMKPEEIQAWMIAHRGDIDLLNTVDGLGGKRILLIGGWNDTLAPIEANIIPLYRALQKKGTAVCRVTLLQSNHGFADVVPELQRSVLDWIRN